MATNDTNNVHKLNNEHVDLSNQTINMKDVNNREKLNNEYIEVSNQIMILNEKRIDILNKLKQFNLEYRKSLGEGSIIETVEIDDNSEEEDKIIVEPKTGVRGRKKKTETEKPTKTEKKVEEPITEPIGETKKNKVKKSTKKEEILEEEILEEEILEEEKNKVKSKKGKKK